MHMAFWGIDMFHGREATLKFAMMKTKAEGRKEIRNNKNSARL